MLRLLILCRLWLWLWLRRHVGASRLLVKLTHRRHSFLSSHRHSPSFSYWKSTRAKDTTWLLQCLHILIIIHSLIHHHILITTTHHWWRGHGRLHLLLLLLLHWCYGYRRWWHARLLMHMRHWHLGVGRWNGLWHPIF